MFVGNANLQESSNLCLECQHTCHCDENTTCPQVNYKEEDKKYYKVDRLLVDERENGNKMKTGKVIGKSDTIFYFNFSDYLIKNKKKEEDNFVSKQVYGPHTVWKKRIVEYTEYVQKDEVDEFQTYDLQKNEREPLIQTKVKVSKSKFTIKKIPIKKEHEEKYETMETDWHTEQVNYPKEVVKPFKYVACYPLKNCVCKQCSCVYSKSGDKDFFIKQLAEAYIQEYADEEDFEKRCLICNHSHEGLPKNSLGTYLRKKIDPWLASKNIEQVKGRCNNILFIETNKQFFYCPCKNRIKKSELIQQFPDYKLNEKIVFFFQCRLSDMNAELGRRRMEYLAVKSKEDLI